MGQDRRRIGPHAAGTRPVLLSLDGELLSYGRLVCQKRNSNSLQLEGRGGSPLIVVLDTLEDFPSPRECLASVVEPAEGCVCDAQCLTSIAEDEPPG